MAASGSVWPGGCRLVLSVVLGNSRDVAIGTPWWKMTRTARQGFILGAFILVLGVFELVLLAAGHPGHTLYWLHWVVTVLFLVLGIACLASAVALRRRERSNHGPGGEASAREG